MRIDIASPLVKKENFARRWSGAKVLKDLIMLNKVEHENSKFYTFYMDF